MQRMTAASDGLDDALVVIVSFLGSDLVQWLRAGNPKCSGYPSTGTCRGSYPSTTFDNGRKPLILITREILNDCGGAWQLVSVASAATAIGLPAHIRFVAAAAHAMGFCAHAMACLACVRECGRRSPLARVSCAFEFN